MGETYARLARRALTHSQDLQALKLARAVLRLTADRALLQAELQQALARLAEETERRQRCEAEALCAGDALRALREQTAEAIREAVHEAQLGARDTIAALERRVRLLVAERRAGGVLP